MHIPYVLDFEFHWKFGSFIDHVKINVMTQLYIGGVGGGDRGSVVALVRLGEREREREREREKEC